MTILVTGATGNVGRNVVDLLARRGAQVRALTRDPSRARVPAGVEVLQGDLNDLDRLQEVLRGVESLFLFPLAYPDQSGQSFTEAKVTTDVPAVAEKAGVRRIVLLSSNAVMYGHDEHHRLAEESVEASSLDWTMLRPGEFATNKIYSWGQSIRAEKKVRCGFPDVLGAPVHEADIAAVAVAALTEDGHAGAKYELTGPQALTERDQVRSIAVGTGIDIAFEELTPEQARQDWIGQGMPPELVDEIMGHYKHFEAHPPTVSPVVEQVTGRPGRTLAQWAFEHADSFR
ncbi:SDR family oxidoreductase [Couchioplanes azureus]|uniref:SDR family oxidoreductase n=1 Tax=Couchioplanes caeruleus TaxID=56438 RepID=UPI0016707A50|nr:NAD(P)H-binding protein [Couchioplanes caeruleus]GGQ86279.1 nucleotide-diphosphate-sugar epimerase [Couchioplanes caeruleus subsp. azureus]